MSKNFGAFNDFDTLAFTEQWKAVSNFWQDHQPYVHAISWDRMHMQLQC